MPRPFRVVLPGVWYHITARGNERRNIFRDDRDRLHFLDCIAEMADRFGVRVHAYVLMGHHYHLLAGLTRLNLMEKAFQMLIVRN